MPSSVFIYRKSTFILKKIPNLFGISAALCLNQIQHIIDWQEAVLFAAADLHHLVPINQAHPVKAASADVIILGIDQNCLA